MVGEERVGDPLTIKAQAVEYFTSIFKEEHHMRPTFQGLEVKKVSSEQQTNLTKK